MAATPINSLERNVLVGPVVGIAMVKLCAVKDTWSKSEQVRIPPLKKLYQKDVPYRSKKFTSLIVCRSPQIYNF